MNDTPELNAVIVAYGSPDLLNRCLVALGAALPVVVIDNSSSEKVHELVARRGCRYVDAGSNIGFAAGVNRALTQLGPHHGDVLLLNPDAQVTAETVRALQSAMRADATERVACTSPALIRDDESAERVQWPFPTPAGAWLEALGLGSMRRQHGFLIGAVLLLHSEAIDEIGFLDEQFFLYAEETDWQRRATNAGWSVRACPTLVARHTGAATSSDDSWRRAVFHASVERYVRKWHGEIGWQIFRAGVILGAGIRSIVTGERVAQRERVLLYLRGPVRCLDSLGVGS